MWQTIMDDLFNYYVMGWSKILKEFVKSVVTCKTIIEWNKDRSYYYSNGHVNGYF